MVSVHCEGEGGTGSASNKGYNNETTNHNCYSFVAISDKSVLKASRELQLSACPN